MSRPLVLAVSEDVGFHVAEAIDLYLRQARRCGRPIPADLPAFARHFLVMTGQAGSSVPSEPRGMNHDVMAPLLLTRAGAAHVLGVSESSVQRLVRAGDLTPVRIGGATRFRTSDLDAYVVALATDPKNPTEPEMRT